MGFLNPDKNGWVSYGFIIQGKLVEVLGSWRVKIETASFIQEKKEE